MHHPPPDEHTAGRRPSSDEDTSPLLVLDIGCGFGRHSIELARRGGEVMGVDPSTAMIEEATQQADAAGSEIEFQQTFITVLATCPTG